MVFSILLKLIHKSGFKIYKPGITDKNAILFRKILQHFKIDLLIDVGANEGQFASSIRKLGYTNKIISFEPLQDVFETLKTNCVKDSNWTAMNIALGDIDGELEINVSKNKVSSSLLEMMPEHIKQEPNSAYVEKQKISVKKLDTVFDDFVNTGNSVYLKLDVQGFEKNVIEGALLSLNKVKLIQLEMALLPLYKGELLLADMIKYMEQKGFILYSLMSGFVNFDTGQQFQVDGIFVRNDLINKQ